MRKSGSKQPRSQNYPVIDLSRTQIPNSNLKLFLSQISTFDEHLLSNKLHALSTGPLAHNREKWHTPCHQ